MSMHHWVFGLGMIFTFILQIYLLLTDQMVLFVSWSLGYFMCAVSYTAIMKIKEQNQIAGQPAVINYQKLIDDLEYKPK